jgi:hypothetical protein
MSLVYKGESFPLEPSAREYLLWGRISAPPRGFAAGRGQKNKKDLTRPEGSGQKIFKLNLFIYFFFRKTF